MKNLLTLLSVMLVTATLGVCLPNTAFADNEEILANGMPYSTYKQMRIDVMEKAKAKQAAQIAAEQSKPAQIATKQPETSKSVIEEKTYNLGDSVSNEKINYKYDSPTDRIAIYSGNYYDDLMNEQENTEKKAIILISLWTALYIISLIIGSILIFKKKYDYQRN